MKNRGIGPHSRRHRLGNIDRRTFEAKLFDEFRAELVAHVGGSPNVVQGAIIERACWLRLRCAMLDAKLAEGSFTDHDSRTYLAWTGALSRLLARLGLQSSAAKAPSLAEVMAEARREREAREREEAAA